LPTEIPFDARYFYVFYWFDDGTFSSAIIWQKQSDDKLNIANTTMGLEKRHPGHLITIAFWDEITKEQCEKWCEVLNRRAERECNHAPLIFPDNSKPH
jgi:hypothetical protein